MLTRLSTGSPLSRAHVPSPTASARTADNLRDPSEENTDGARTMSAPHPARPRIGYWIMSKMANIGMYRAMTMPPTIPPMTPISSGSIMAVRDSVVDSISMS